MYKPKGFPRNPHQVYTEEWEGWPKFLNSDNVFPQPRKWRAYKDAWTYARQSPCRTMKEWLAHSRPDDIPSRPDLVYRGFFTGWKSFLGTKMKPSDAVLQAQLGMSEPHSQSDPFYVGYDPASGFYMMAWSRDMLASCSSIMAWEVDNRTLLSEIQTRHCQHQGGGDYLIGNVHEFLFEMNTSFMPIRKTNLT